MVKTTVYITDRDVMNCLASDFGWADCVSCRKKNNYFWPV
jgi:hypothetical protein